MRPARRAPTASLAILMAAVGAVASTAQPALDPRVRDLMDQLEGDDWTQRTLAASTLGTLGAAAVPAIPLLIAPLKDTQQTPRIYRSTVPITLGMIGPPAKAALPALIEVLRAEDPDPDDPEASLWESARGNAAYAVGMIGPADRAAATPALLDAARDARGRVRANALSALATLGLGSEGQRAVPVLVRVLEDWKDLAEGQQSAAELLGTIGPAAKSAVPALTAALKSRSDGVRQAAAEALRKIQK